MHSKGRKGDQGHNKVQQKPLRLGGQPISLPVRIHRRGVNEMDTRQINLINLISATKILRFILTFKPQVGSAG